MKKYYHYIVLLFFLQTTTAQTLFTENFENCTLGNMFTTVSDKTIPGQGGWYLLIGHSDASMVNAYKITQEPNKGKVLTLTTNKIPTEKVDLFILKQGLGMFVDQRTAGNNVIKLEVDYYIGEKHNFGTVSSLGFFYGNIPPNLNNSLILIGFNTTSGVLQMRYNNGSGMNYDMLDNSSSSRGSNLPFNTWVKIIVYMDYDNRKIYSEIPLLNTFAVSDQFLVNSTSTDILEDFKLTTIYIQHAVNDYGRNIPLTNKCDNIKITALNAVPPHILSAESFLATKFNMYPNPATNLVTITNNEEAFINQIEIYDTAGKLLTTKNYNNKTEIQLNIAPLANGTYMLHLTTGKGKAVKKLVKK